MTARSRCARTLIFEVAAKGAVYGAFYCAGQVCSATNARRVQDEFLEAVVQARGLKLGDPFDDETLVGPMQNEPTAQKMDEYFEDAAGKGAQVVVGGFERRPRGLLPADRGDQRDPRPPSLTTRNLWPIVPLISVDGADDALAVANESHLGLQGPFTRATSRGAFRFADGLRVGSVVVNDSTLYGDGAASAAAGTKTGWGRVGGRYVSLEDMTDCDRGRGLFSA